MRNWKQIRVDADIDIFYCDPHAPCQRGTTRTPTACSASTSPRAPTFATITEAELDAVADELNDRPRKRLVYAKPIEEISDLLSQ
jgi:transposase, IS30 family